MKNKTSKGKKLSEEEAQQIGFNAEEAMANLILSKLGKGAEQEIADLAIISSFQALVFRMLHFWEKDMFFDIINTLDKDVGRELMNSSCNDCKDKLH